jgi:predicted nucleic acid-binding protein
MIAVDTNILIYAHREETPQHALAKSHIERLARGFAPWSIPVFCLSEFVRVVTHPRVFAPPSPLATALAFVDALLESPTVIVLVPDADYV